MYAPPSHVDLIGLFFLKKKGFSLLAFLQNSAEKGWKKSVGGRQALTHSSARAIRTVHSAGASCRISVSLCTFFLANALRPRYIYRLVGWGILTASP